LLLLDISCVLKEIVGINYSCMTESEKKVEATPSASEQTTKVAKPEKKLNQWIFIIGAILFFPITIGWLIWTKVPGKITKILCLAALVVLVVGLAVLGYNAYQEANRVDPETVARDQKSSQEREAKEKLDKLLAERINYNVVTTTADKQSMTRVITIDKRSNTKENMEKFGKQLDRENSSKVDVVVVHVFIDRKAADMYGKVKTLSKADQDFYTKNYVGYYERNQPKGIHKFVYNLEGNPEGTGSTTVNL
jgi:hypothetical protein